MCLNAALTLISLVLVCLFLFSSRKNSKAFKFQFLVNHVTTSLGLPINNAPSVSSHSHWPAPTERGRVISTLRRNWLKRLRERRIALDLTASVSRRRGGARGFWLWSVKCYYCRFKSLARIQLEREELLYERQRKRPAVFTVTVGVSIQRDRIAKTTAGCLCGRRRK